jgi:hypothetical protein
MKPLTVIGFLLLASQSLGATTSEINLSCVGKLQINGQSQRESERGFVLEGKKIYFAGNEVPCEITPDRIRCWKWNESKSKWAIEIDRVSGRVDYSFTNLPLGIVEEFRGKCEVVKRVF